MQFGVDRLPCLQQSEELIGADVAPFHLLSEVPRSIVDTLLPLRRPASSVVRGDRGNARNRAVPDERTHVFDSLVQTSVQPHRPRGVEECAGGVDHAGDAVLRKRRDAAEIRLVFSLYQGDMHLAVVGRLEVQGIDSEIVAPVDDAVKRLRVGQVECGPGDEEQECDRTSPGFVGSQPQLVVESVRLSLNDSGHLLVDDLRGKRHRSHCRPVGQLAHRWRLLPHRFVGMISIAITLTARQTAATMPV